LAVKAKRISRDHPPGIALLRESEPRQGFFEPAEFARLRDALPDYLKNAVTFLCSTGWRKGAMRMLEWVRDVRLEFGDAGDIVGGTVTLQAENAKNKRPQRLPLTGELLEVIRRAWDNRVAECPYVFHDAGRPRKPGDDKVDAIGDFRKSWLTRAGRRASAASWFTICDVPARVTSCGLGYLSASRCR
jgi:integrase